MTGMCWRIESAYWSAAYGKRRGLMGRKTGGVETLDRWNAFQTEKKDNRLDAEERSKDAIHIADKVTKPVTIVPVRETSVGKRRRAMHNQWQREPIGEYSLQHSNIARHVTGLRFGGEAQREAFQSAADKFDLKPHSIEVLYHRKRELFDLAEHELMETAVREYHQNLWISRTALSEVGPMAVDTLAEILEDPDASASVKSKSAIAVLKMLDIDGSSNANPNERVALESLKMVRDVKLASMKEEESHVRDIDAEDAEIVEEEKDEDRTSCTM